MSANKDFILYKGFEWQRTFILMTANGVFNLTGYGITIIINTAVGGTNLATLTIGNGITVDLVNNTFTATITGTQSNAFNTTNMPLLSVTELIASGCCDDICPDVKIGPTGVYEIYLTDPFGNLMQPFLSGAFQIFSAV